MTRFDGPVKYFMVVPLRFLDGPDVDRMKADAVQTMAVEGHIYSGFLAESRMIEDGLRIVTAEELAGMNSPRKEEE